MTTTTSSQDTESLIQALRDNLSPQAVALIVAKCQPTYGKGEAGAAAEKEVAWFTETIAGMLGRVELDRLYEEVGV